MSALKNLDFAIFPLDNGCILINEVSKLIRVKLFILSLSLSTSHTFVLPFAMRHKGGGGSDGSSLVRAMVMMSSSSLDCSLDETSVTHFFFYQEASLGVAFLLWEELGLLVMALLLPKFLVFVLLFIVIIIA